MKNSGRRSRTRIVFAIFFLAPAAFSISPLFAEQQMNAAQQTNPASQANPAQQMNPGQTNPALNDDERQLFEAVNRERTAQSLTPLQWDEALAKAARLHARRMAFYNQIEHQLSGEPNLEARLTEVGARFGAMAENIGVGASPEVVHDGWMHSPGHRGNILNPKMTAVGIAAIRTNVGMFAVQDFTMSVSSLSLEEQENKVAALLAKDGWQVGGSKADARKSCETDQIESGTRVRQLYLVRFETADLSQVPEEVERRMRSKPFRNVTVGACQAGTGPGFVHYRIALLLY